ncbi:MAG: endolytic transglycosylase MltG [Pseudomonadota bacterium]
MIRWLFSLLVCSLLFAAGAAGYFKYWQQQPLNLGQSVVLEVHPGDSLTNVVDALHRVMPTPISNQSPRLFTLLAYQRNAAGKIQVGEYELAPGITPVGVLQLLEEGRVVQHEFRIIEGTTVKQLLLQLAAESRLGQTLQAADQTELAAELNLATPYSEGLFFPDTYLFRKGSTDADLLQRAHQALQDHLQSVWEGRASAIGVSDPYQALILASIIEKESALVEDQHTISQVFHNRLSRGMRLQTDPTVIYGIGERFDGNLTRQHLRTDTPYNSYTRHGLPPTPIALVSRAALEAAVHPSQGDYLYFVARGDGSSQFSQTLEEHNAAVRRFQLKTRS